ncbi:MAG: menaquinone-dependent protoporphyrinogen oxidase [Devosia sp.]|jgi:menaquinone-dependent protoporphyrinogen oxidase|tara:strand:- start:770 stop:1336 length:567 start_codon:yes stop_codon:yes gene_type:complete
MAANPEETAMTVLIAYATSEGQTRKIARHIADRIADGGGAVELVHVADAEEIELGRFDRVILAGSIHIGHYQRALSDFAARYADQLNSGATLFVSVSLAAAGHDADDWNGFEPILDDFKAATGWTPGHVAQVAGAYQPSRYDIFRRFVMRRIVASKQPAGTDLDADKEYTDWPALDALVDGWIRTPAQ